MKRLRIKFYPTDEEGESDQQRQMADAYFQDWIFGRIRRVDNFTEEEIKKEDALVDDLMRRQDNEIWVTGWGYLDKDEVNIFKRIHGLLKSILSFRIDFCEVETEQEELIPF